MKRRTRRYMFLKVDLEEFGEKYYSNPHADSEIGRRR